MNAMHSFAKVTATVVATAFDLSSFKTACDLGGKNSNSYFLSFDKKANKQKSTFHPFVF